MTTLPSLRIAQIIHYFRAGGLEQLALRLATAYRALGHEAHVIAYEDGPLREKFQQAGVITHVLPRPPRLSPRFVLQMAGFFTRQQFDLIHTHHIGPMLYGVPAAHLCCLPSVHTTHSNEHLYPPQAHADQEGAAASYRRMFQWLAKRCSHIVTVNEALATFLREDVGVKTPVSAVPNGVDPAQFHGNYDVTRLRQELSLPEHVPVLGVIARLEPEKGHRHLLEALGQLQQPAVLVVIGDGSLRESLTAQAEALGLADKVRFLGLRHDLPQLFSALDIMVLPSLREGLPLVILEAMASHVPIVATAVGNVPDVLQHSGAGVVVPPGDSKALTKALQGLLANQGARDKMAQAGRAWVLEHYSQDKMVQRYLEIYHQSIHTLQTPSWRRPLYRSFVSIVQMLPGNKVPG